VATLAFVTPLTDPRAPFEMANGVQRECITSETTGERKRVKYGALWEGGPTIPGR